MKRTEVPEKYDFEKKILEFSEEDHGPESRFCYCTGGFGAKSYLSGRMILGDFAASIEDIFDGKTRKGNTKAFPIAIWEAEL